MRPSFRLLALCAAAVVLAIVALPQEWRSWVPVIGGTKLHLGLDLAGGTQLDFRISEQEMRDQLAQLDSAILAAKQRSDGTELNALQVQRQGLLTQQQNIVEAIRTVLERRINSLGVSEAIITPSYIGGEKHLLVECPGVVNVDDCIATVGKTIKLEFKEEFTEATDTYKADVRSRAQAALRRITGSGETLDVLGQDLGGALGAGYVAKQTVFKDTVPKGLESLWSAKPDGTVRSLEGSLHVNQQDAQGNPVSADIEGVFLVQVLTPLTATGRTVLSAEEAFTYLASQDPTLKATEHASQAVDSSIAPSLAKALTDLQPGSAQVAVGTGAAQIVAVEAKEQPATVRDLSNIVVTYSGAVQAPKGVTRTKEEARQLATAVLAQLKNGGNFATLARQYSDVASKTKGGAMGLIAKGSLPQSFDDEAFTLKSGDISGVVETSFGFHIIRANADSINQPLRVTYRTLFTTGSDAGARMHDLFAKLQNGEVKRQEPAQQLRMLFFSFQPTGWKDTELDGKHFRSAGVTVDQGGVPVVQILFDQQGGQIFQELTKRNIGKRIAIFVGGDLVSAPNVQQEISGGTAVISGVGNFQQAQELAQELNTGAIPAPIFLSGQRTVEATLGSSALLLSIHAAIIGMVILILYLIAWYRLLGVVAGFALSIYIITFYALLKLPLLLVTDQYVVLTAAGIAGIILSIGMAVDANVLIFERTKEELRKGKGLKTAVALGFERAWPSIRDGNASTLITSAILFTFGTSIVRGFAVSLCMGIVLSLFTAIVISRWVINWLVATPLGQRPELFGGVKPNMQ